MFYIVSDVKISNFSVLGLSRDTPQEYKQLFERSFRRIRQALLHGLVVFCGAVLYFF